MSSGTFPLLCMLIFIFIILAMIIMLVLKGKRDRLSSFTPEQQKAIKLQNNASIIWVVILVTGIFLSPVMEKISPELANGYRNMLIFLGIGVMILIALSSIISKVSILKGRGARDDFSQDKAAVNFGTMILVFLGLALLLWLAQK